MQELGHELRPLEDVRATILAHVEALPPVRRATGEALGDVLRADVVSSVLVPPFDNSAMDGYAVHSADTLAAEREAPVDLPVRATVRAGDQPTENLSRGAALRIMTGAPLPPGADAVVPHEVTEFTETRVRLFAPIVAGKNVRRAGGDVRPGDVALRAGTVLRPWHLALAGTLGHEELEVSRRPRVAVISPGDELVPIGERPGPGKIRNSNALSLCGLLRETGCEPIDLGIVSDSLAGIRGAIRAGLDAGADAFVSSGGVSAGDFDLVREVVLADGDPGWSFKVAMRPGKPQAFGLIEGRPFFGLPGNPAASITSFAVLVRPALRKMRGEANVLPRLFPVRFEFEHAYRRGRVFLLRTRVEPDDEGGFRVVPPGEQDSSYLASLADANAIVVLPAERDRIAEGESCPAFWLGGREP